MPNAFMLLEASTGKETINGILSEQPDLVFLDIKMTDMTGFEVIEHLPKEKIPSLIFVTAYNHFALQAFEVQALDYLLKPFKKERFLEALERGLQRIELDQIKHFQENVKGLIRLLEKSKDNPWAEKESYLDKVVLKLNKKYFFLDVSDILYIKASGYYAEIFTTKNQKHLYRTSMGNFIKQLDPHSFSRVNRSAIINRNYLKEVISEGFGDFSLVMNDQETFGISKNYKEEFLQLMGIKS